MPETPANPSQSYSIFHATFAVFLTLVLLQAVYVIGDFSDRSQIERARAELGPLTAQARKITEVVEDLGKDLLALSAANNAEAAKIVTELNIKTNPPSAAR